MNPSKAWIILILLSLVWGSSFILIKKGLIAFDALELAILRVSISGLAFFPLFLHYIPQIEKKKMNLFVLTGLTGLAIPSFLYAFAQTEINSSATGIFNSLTPIFTLILGILFFNMVLTTSKVVGVLIGFGGACLLILLGESSGLGEKPWYAIFVILGTLCYAINVNLVKKYFQHTKAILISVVSFFSISVPVILYIPFTNIPEILTNHPHGWQSLTYIAILAIFSTVLATVIFFYIVQKTNAVFASSVAYLIPVVALMWGNLDGELLSAYHFIGLGLILSGVFMIRRDQPRNSVK